MIFIFKQISSNNSVANLFLILQNYVRKSETWRPPSSPNRSANQNAGTTKMLPPSGEEPRVTEVQHNADKHSLFVVKVIFYDFKFTLK